MNSAESHHPHEIEIFINDIGHRTYHHEMTGQQIKQLGRVPDYYSLVRRTEGKEEKKVPDSDRIQLHNHDRFHAIHERHEIVIVIHGVTHRTKHHELTGAELKTLGEVPADYDLFRKVHGKYDEKIQDTENVHLYDNDHFYGAPKSLNPGATR
jgi:hypothetical protein